MNKINLYESPSRDRLFICNRYLFGEFKYLSRFQRLEILFISRFSSLPISYCVDVRGFEEVIERSVWDVRRLKGYSIIDESVWDAIHFPALQISTEISTDLFMRQLSPLLRIEELYE